MKTVAAAVAILAFSACASNLSARYVQITEVQVNLNRRTAEALDAGLIDAATGKRILAISEAVTEKRAEYRTALAEGRELNLLRSILDVIERLLARADLFLPDALLLGKESP